jgi:hypothetical protein
MEPADRLRRSTEPKVGGSNPSGRANENEGLGEVGSQVDGAAGTDAGTKVREHLEPSILDLTRADAALANNAEADVANAGVRCDCGASLAHVAGVGVRAVLCPECDADRLAELTDDAQPGTHEHLAALGREAARDAWPSALVQSMRPSPTRAG